MTFPQNTSTQSSTRVRFPPTTFLLPEFFLLQFFLIISFHFWCIIFTVSLDFHVNKILRAFCTRVYHIVDYRLSACSWKLKFCSIYLEFFNSLKYFFLMNSTNRSAASLPLFGLSDWNHSKMSFELIMSLNEIAGQLSPIIYRLILISNSRTSIFMNQTDIGTHGFSDEMLISISSFGVLIMKW